MNLLPKASGHRPRLACEISLGGVVAARSPEPGLPLATVSKADLADTTIVPSLKPGNITDRVAVIAALRRVLEESGGRANARNADLTLVIPDGAVRVLLLEFDSLPNKLSEALPLVRFRLKKLIPFEPDDAMVSFQVLSTSRTMVRVLAVAVPRDVLGEYESVVREAGFEPGAVLPSTLAALAGLSEGDGASLVVNAHATGVTTAIVRAGIVLLHRSIELAELAPAAPANLPASLVEPGAAAAHGDLPRNGRDARAGGWDDSQQSSERAPGDYVDGIYANPGGQEQQGASDLSVSSATGEQDDAHLRRAQAYSSAADPSFYVRREPAQVEDSPYLAPTVAADLNAELHNAILVAPTYPGTLTDPAAVRDLRERAASTPAYALDGEDEPPVHTLAADVQAEEIANAVSVAVAYFEDTLGAAPQVLLSAGPLSAEGLDRLLREQGIAQQDGLRVRELVDPINLGSGASTASVPRSWLAGVVGALRS